MREARVIHGAMAAAEKRNCLALRARVAELESRLTEREHVMEWVADALERHPSAEHFSRADATDTLRAELNRKRLSPFEARAVDAALSPVEPADSEGEGRR